MLRIDWLAKLRYFLQTVAFCLAVAAIEYMFQPQIPYEFEMLYSVSIGTCIWASVDLGRHAFPSAAETGWPQGLWAWLLPLAGIANGFVLGTLLGDSVLGADSFGSRAFEQMLTSVAVTLMAGVVASFYFYSKTRGLYLERRVRESHRQAAEARLKLLETQLEPHMMFNTLANLRALIGVDPARAQTMLDHMIAYLRATLSASRADPNRPHTLQDEFARLQDYLELMAIRMGPRLQYTLDLPEDLRAQPVPPLLLQPLVENSIQHGLEPKVEGGSIRVRASRQGEWLRLEVADTGLGWAPSAGPRARPGFGLQQVRERLSTAFGTLGTMDTGAAAATGTRVTITFPCTMHQPTALLAEDEPLLAQALQAELALAWPTLQVLRTVGDGNTAVQAALALQPDVLFFDIRMPGQSGLEAAAELADAWPTHGPQAKPFPALVFVTAYDQYAVQAFEAQAVDYVLKPVQGARLQKTVLKLQAALASAAAPAQGADSASLEATLAQLRSLLAPAVAPTAAPLQVLQASVGQSIHLIPVEEVLYLEAADKYLRVLTATQEYLLRTPLKELLPQLDAQVFWQTHRGTVVRAQAIRSVNRDEAGRLSLTLHHRSEKLPVSRLYAHRFKAM